MSADTRQDEVLAIEEIKQTYEKLYGWTKQGERTDLTLSSDEKVTLPKLAKELNVSDGKLSQDLQLAKGIKKHPEIAKVKSKRKAFKKAGGSRRHPENV